MMNDDEQPANHPDTPDLVGLLNAAAERGDLGIVDRLLNDQAQILARAQALENAARYNHLEVINRLLRDAPETLDRTRAYVAALYCEHQDVINRLLNDAPQILDYARETALDVVNGLLEVEPAILTYSEALNIAAACDHLEVVDSLLNNSLQTLERASALEEAAHYGHLGGINRLLDGAPETLDRTNAFVIALYSGYPQIATTLLADTVLLDGRPVIFNNAEAVANDVILDLSIEPSRLLATAMYLNHSNVAHQLLDNDERATLEAARRHAQEVVDGLLNVQPEILTRFNALGRAIQFNHAEVVSSFIPNNEMPVPIRLWGLNLAAQLGHLETVNIFLNNAPEALDRTQALENAALHGYLEVVDRLLDGAPETLDRTSAVVIALYLDHVNIASRLLEGAPVNTTQNVRRIAPEGVNYLINESILQPADALVVAATQNHPEVVTHLLANTTPALDRMQALGKAALHGCLEVVDRLLDGAPETLDRTSAVVMALYLGHVNIASRLLEGAPVNTTQNVRRIAPEGVNYLINESILQPANALVVAATQNHPEVITQVLANTTPALDRTQALENAALHGYLEVVDRLLDGAPETLDRTRAYVAALYCEHQEVINRLLNDAPQILDYARETALDVVNGLLEVEPAILTYSEALNVAAAWDHVEVVHSLLNNSLQTLERASALEEAAHYGHLGVINRLLDGAPATLDRTNAFVTALYSGYPQIATAILADTPILPDGTPVIFNNAEAAAIDIIPDLSIDSPRLLATAMYLHHWNVAHQLLNDDELATPEAAGIHAREVVDGLLNVQPEILTRPNAFGRAIEFNHAEVVVGFISDELPVRHWALNLATRLGHLEIVDICLNGAPEVLDRTSAVVMALYLNHVNIASRLLDDAPVNTTENVRRIAPEGVNYLINESILQPANALVVAATQNHPEVVTQVLANTTPALDRTQALENAALRGCLEVVDRLLDGAPETLDRTRALVFALYSGQVDIANRLQNGAPAIVDHVQQVASQIIPAFGLPINPDWSLATAMYLNHSDVINYFLQNELATLERAEVKAAEVVGRLLTVQPAILTPLDAFLRAIGFKHIEVVNTLPFGRSQDFYDNPGACVIAAYLCSENIAAKFLNRAPLSIRENVRRMAQEIISDLMNNTSTTLRPIDALFMAAKHGHVEVVTYLLSADQDQALDRTNALKVAAGSGHLETVDKLLEGTTQPPWSEMMVAAVGGGQLEMINKLLEIAPHDAIDWTAALKSAATGGHLEIVNKLLEVAPQTIDRAPAFVTALYLGNTAIASSLISNAPGGAQKVISNASEIAENIVSNLLSVEPRVLDSIQAYATAIYMEHKKVAKEFENDGTVTLSNVEAHAVGVVTNLLKIEPAIFTYYEALTTAAEYNHVEVVTSLLSDQLQKSIFPQELEDVLRVASECGHVEVVDILLRDPSQTLNREKALKAAAEFNQVEVVDRLLDGAPPDLDRTNAFVSAIYCGSPDVATRLLVDVPAVTITSKAAAAAKELYFDFLDENSSETLATAMYLDHSEVTNELLDKELSTHENAREVAPKVVAKLLQVQPEILSPADALRRAASYGHLEVLNTLPVSAAQDFYRSTEASVIAAYLSDENIATEFLNRAPVGIRESVRRMAPEIVSDLINTSRILHPINALFMAAKHGHVEVVTYLLSADQDQTLDRTNALKVAAGSGHLETVDKLLEGTAQPPWSEMMVAAAGGGQLEMVNKLLEIVPHDAIDWTEALKSAAFSGHAKIVNRLLSRAPQDIDRLRIRADMSRYHEGDPGQVPENEIKKIDIILRRPVTRFFALPAEEEAHALEERSRWINDVMGMHPRVDKEVMPPLSEAVQPWLPIKEEGARKEKTGKFAALDNPVTDAVMSFAAFVYMAETTSDFAKNKDSYKKRMWELLGALIDKDHPKLKGSVDKNGLPTGGMTDAEHAGLREMVFAQSTEALGECVDRLSNGFKRFERIITYETAKHYQTIDEHADFLKKMFIDDTKDRIAAIKAAEIQLDGYRFPNDHEFRGDDRRAGLRRNPDEQVEVRALLDAHMGPNYQMDKVPQVMRYESYVLAEARDAKPEKYGTKTNEEIAQEMAKEAEKIIDGLINGESEPPALKALIDSANTTREADRRGALRLKETSLMTLAEYAAKEHPLWKDIIEKEFPEQIKRIKDKATELRKTVKEQESAINGLQDVITKLHIMELEKANLPSSSKHEAILKISEEHNQVNKKHEEATDALYKTNMELWHYENEAIPEMLEDITQQYFGAQPFIEKYVKEGNIKDSQCKWEPLGRDKRLPGANYFVIGDNRKENGKTCLRLDAATKNSTRFVMIDTKKLLEQLKALANEDSTLKQEIVPGQKFYIKGKEGKINSIEYKGMAGSSSSQAIGAGDEHIAKKRRY